MDENIILFLNECGIQFKVPKELDGVILSREIFLSPETYQKVKPKIEDMKKKFSSSSLTSLHKMAGETQKWPLLNLVRQILKVYKYRMDPVRKSDGSDETGKKKYKRFFRIRRGAKKQPQTTTPVPQTTTPVPQTTTPVPQTTTPAPEYSIQSSNLKKIKSSGKTQSLN